MKKIKVDPIPDTLLQISNGYKIAAATWIIECVMKNMADCTQHLNAKEKDKVDKEVNKILDTIRNKRSKLHKII